MQTRETANQTSKAALQTSNAPSLTRDAPSLIGRKAFQPRKTTVQVRFEAIQARKFPLRVTSREAASGNDIVPPSVAWQTSKMILRSCQ
jgi:hypothetical protein